MNHKKLTLVVTAIATTSFSSVPVYADAISPQIRDKGNVYSREKPDTGFYGTGPAGRAMEAMQLRFDVERLLQDSEYDQAIAKAKKACQLDPGDPECHLLLARALTRKFYTKEGPIDEKLLRECLGEWLLIWHHDSDQFEQVEAKNEARRMIKIAKVLDKKHKAEMEAKLAAREQMAKQRAKEDAEGQAKAATKPEPAKQAASKKDEDEEGPL